ncbi:hypothetical protein [Rothia nasimurium]|uniref:hypothetical protein n=1 Tax=Rothia nasimurium TaxID=85336 RepID=UPI003BA11E74
MNQEFVLDDSEYEVESSDNKIYAVYQLTTNARIRLGGFTSTTEEPESIRAEAELVIAETQ